MEYVLKGENKKNLIVLVHGLTGGKETWIENGVKRIPDYLLENNEITENFDVGYFEYFTKLTDRIGIVKWLMAYALGKSTPLKRNLSIADIKDILYSELENLSLKYDKIVIIAHSMGGLISKSAILKAIEEENTTVSLFLSLCVPHNGAGLANIGGTLLRNKHIKDLSLLNPMMTEVNRKWLLPDVRESLPETIYFQGKNDIVVANASSEGYEARKPRIVFTEDDHFSILVPSSGENLVMSTMIGAILETLKKKATAERRPIAAELSQESMDQLTQNISEKLNLSIPDFGKTVLAKDSVPELSSNGSTRQNTIEGLINKIVPWLAIYGIYDTGKTQLAALIQKQLALNTIWISFKDIDNKYFRQKVLNAFDAVNDEELALAIAGINVSSLLVLDDLPRFGQDQAMDDFFIKFIRLCTAANMKILSTSNFKITNTIKAVHNSLLTEEPIPLLDKEECEEILATYPDSSGFSYGWLIQEITGGYPIYVQVICRYLQANNWTIEKDRLLEFINGDLFDDLTDETLNRFVSKVQDEVTRNLLYRLNIIRTSITVKEVKIVSECSPEIERPFEKIIPATGTWIQKESEAYYLSPLFKRLGVKNVPEYVFKEASYLLGLQLLEKEMLSPLDVKHALSYFSDSKKMENAGFVVFNLLRYAQEHHDYIFETGLDFYTWHYDTLPDTIPLFIRLMIRSLQLNLEMLRKGENANMEFLRNDLVALVSQGLQEKVDVYFPALILSSSYLREDSLKALKYFSYYINSPTYNNLPELTSYNTFEAADLDHSMVWLLLMNINDKKSLEEWFATMEHLDPTAREKNDEQSFLIADKLFINFIVREVGSDAPNWQEVLNIFLYIYEKAQTLGLNIIKGLAIKNMIHVLGDRMDGINQAEELFISHKDSITDEQSMFLITDELGRQFFNTGQHKKAMKYLLEAEVLEVPKYFTSKADTYRILAEIEGTQNQAKAHAYMEKAMEFLNDNIFINELIYINFIGEYAISLFLTNRLEEAMLEFIKGYDILTNTFEHNTAYINSQLRYGNGIGYLATLIERGSPPGDNFTKPYRGMFMKSNDLTDIFFAGKIHMVIFIIIEFLESLNRDSEAKYWADKMEKMQEKYDVGSMQRILTTLLGYAIREGKYEEAFEKQIIITQRTLAIANGEVSQSANSHEQMLAESIRLAETAVAHDIDLELIIFVLNPILYHLLTRLLREEISPENLATSIKGLLEKYSNSFKNPDFQSAINHILDNFPFDSDKAKVLMSFTNELPSPTQGQIQFFSYLICSLWMPPREALDTHFKIAVAFPLYKGVTDNTILTPFFMEYWIRKIKTDTASFTNTRKLEENLEKIKDLKRSLQLKAIFALTAESCGYTPSSSEKIWLRDYYDEYGE